MTTLTLTTDTDTNGTQPSEDDESKAYAVLFVNDLQTNTAMRRAWAARLAYVKAPDTKLNGRPLTNDEKLKILDNFIADHGYDTTSAAVLALIKDPMYQEMIAAKQANADSDLFVQQLLTDAKFYKAYLAQVQAAAQTGKNDALDAWIAAQPKPPPKPPAPAYQRPSYACTAEQIVASFNNMRNHNLNYWTGLYGTAVIQPCAGDQPDASSMLQRSSTPPGQLPKSAGPAPSLIIYGDTTATLGPDQIMNFTYSKGTLSWTNDLNTTGGELTFSQVRNPSDLDGYVGNEVSGTLTYPTDGSTTLSGKYTYFARVSPGNLPANQQGNINHPPSVTSDNEKSIAKAFQYLGWAVTAGMAIEMGSKLIGWLRGGGQEMDQMVDKIANKVTEKLKADAQDAEAVEESPIEELDANYETSTTVEQLEANMGDVPTPEQLQELQEVQGEQQQYDEDLADASNPDGGEDAGEDAADGDSWGEDLADVGEDLL